MQAQERLSKGCYQDRLSTPLHLQDPQVEMQRMLLCQTVTGFQAQHHVAQSRPKKAFSCFLHAACR